MGAGEARISTTRAVASPQISPKASCLVIPTPLRPPISSHSSRLVKIAPNDGVQRVNIGAAYTRWRLHRSAYQSKLTSPLRTARETSNQVLRFQENLKAKLKGLADTEGNQSPTGSSKPPAQKLTYRLHNRKRLPALLLSNSSSKPATPANVLSRTATPKSATAKSSADLAPKLKSTGSKPEFTLHLLREASVPGSDTASDLSALATKMRSLSLKKTSSVESLRETPDSIISQSKLYPDQGILARLRDKGLAGLSSKMRRASAMELPAESTAIRGEELPPVETRGLLVAEAEQGLRRGSAY